MIDRPSVCPRCGAGTVYRETDADGTRWYCLICSWREAPALESLPLGWDRTSRKTRHAGWEL